MKPFITFQYKRFTSAMGKENLDELSDGFFSNLIATSALTLLVIGYITFFCATSFMTYWNFGMSAYDIGIHDQAIWKLSTFRGFFNTVRGMNIWGDHCWLIMIFIAPFYWIMPRLETLLTIQTVALASGAFPLAAYAYRKCGSRPAAVLLAAAFLLSPALQNMNLENAHPEVLALPFILWMIAAAEIDAWFAYGIAMLLALFCKEDIALTTFALGFYVFLRRNRTAGLMTMILSAAYFLVCMKLILPFWNGSGFFRFQNGYWFSEFWTHKLEAGYYIEVLGQPIVAQYSWRLFFPVLGLCFFNPILFLAAMPGFLINVLSGNVYLIGIDYHYNYHTLPIVFAAAASGIGAIQKMEQQRRFNAVIIAFLLFTASVFSNLIWSQAPITAWWTRIQHQWHHLETSKKQDKFEKLTVLLPKNTDIPIAASHNFIPALAHRNEVYMFPNPWKLHYWGIAGENRKSPDRVQWIVIDKQSIGSDNLPLLSHLINSGEFRKVNQQGDWLLAERELRPQVSNFTKIHQIKPPDGDWLQAAPPAQGIRAIIFLYEKELTSLNPFSGVIPDHEIQTSTLSIPQTHGILSLADSQTLRGVDNIRVVFIGKWFAIGTKETVFKVQADDGCRIYLNGTCILDYDGVHPFSNEGFSEPVLLNEGENIILVDYFEWGGEAGLNIQWRSEDGRFQNLQSGAVLP